MMLQFGWKFFKDKIKQKVSLVNCTDFLELCLLIMDGKKRLQEPFPLHTAEAHGRVSK